MIGIKVMGTEELVQQRLEEANSSLLAEDEDRGLDSLHSHILTAYQENKDHKESSGINRLLLSNLKQYNGEYSLEDSSRLQEEGGSRIFMKLTATKVRATVAWIKDILMAEKGNIFTITSTPDPSLPDDLTASIEEKLTAEFDAMPEGDIAETLKEFNEKRRDLYDSIQEEKQKEADFACRIYERRVADQLKEGEWDKALSEFIDDFCIFPTAILKGPIVTKKKCLKWSGGMPTVDTEYQFLNKRVSPFDVYPAPEAASPDTGNFIEYMRLSRKEVSSLLGTKNYKDENIRKVLEFEIGKGLSEITDTHIEHERADAEFKDNAFDANKNSFHGLHFFGTAPAKILREWGLADGIEDLEDEEEADIEAILIGSEVVKCVLNKDPLGRRPYYIASLQRRPGSFWGSSIPDQMSDIQKMCNATARALDNNMGLASGPIMELYVDRLADGTDVTELRPRDIVQVTSDPTGGSGRAIQFFTVPSNAAELIAVYEKFEQRADDVTMIPRYAYGNERSGGASSTASGMAMLLESAGKGIKNAVRHIDEGVIVPRVQTEFYYMMLESPDKKFTGDIKVIAKGSQAYALRGAEQMRRNEFLQITANPVDQKLLGYNGRAAILRKIADELGLGENIIPGRQELKKLAAQEAQMAEENAKQTDSLAITQMQMDAMMQVAQANNTIKMEELTAKREKDLADVQLRVQELEQKREADTSKVLAAIEKQRMAGEVQTDSANKAIALSLQTGDKANNV